MSSKNAVSLLAIGGSPPAFEQALHVGRPNIGDRDALMRRIDIALDRRWLTNNGLLVQEFERRIEQMLGVKHCVAMCNATLALEVAARACGLTGEVIVPSFTFVATVHALTWIGLTPVFCDVDPATHNIDPGAAERLVTDRTSAILGVHVWGRACDVDGLADISRRRRLTLLFDAAHAFGCSAGGRMVGNFGRCEVFSFHATKFVNSFEGGALVTNDDDIASRARLMINFGFAGVDTVVSHGTNAKMNEVCAAMGLTSLDALPEIVALNAAHHRQYQQLLQELPGVKVVQFDPAEQSNCQYVVVEIDEDKATVSRDELKDVLWAENVFARRYFYPGCHRMEPYVSHLPLGTLPETDTLCRRVLSLPTGTAVTREDVGVICSLIATAVRNGSSVREQLQRRAHIGV
jgi:dTDP-4-amino-4,6-dideoxygalactose transaminase